MFWNFGSVPDVRDGWRQTPATAAAAAACACLETIAENTKQQDYYITSVNIVVVSSPHSLQHVRKKELKVRCTVDPAGEYIVHQLKELNGKAEIDDLVDTGVTIKENT